MSISTGWREQYDRMNRSYERLVAVSQGEHPDARSSDTARDVLYHFFQDAYHLKDWIAATTPAIGGKIEARIKDSTPLRLCADLCNGTKHFRLDPRRKHWTDDPTTAFSAQDVTVRPGARAARLARVALHIPRRNAGRPHTRWRRRRRVGHLAARPAPPAIGGSSARPLRRTAAI
jgi:hypothetical protein